MKLTVLKSGWRNESSLMSRYVGSGVVNTLVGFVVIFVAMAVGFSPMVSNITGYAVGFVFGFVLSKKFIFRSDGHFVTEGVRYLVAFVISFCFNLLVLHLSFNYFNNNVVFSQVAAAGSYSMLMYLLTRLFVFRCSKLAVRANGETNIEQSKMIAKKN